MQFSDKIEKNRKGQNIMTIEDFIEILINFTAEEQILIEEKLSNLETLSASPEEDYHSACIIP